MVKLCTVSFMETRQRVNLLLLGHREKEARADVVSIQGVRFLTLYKNAFKLALCIVHSLFVRTFIAHFKANSLRLVPSEIQKFVLDI
jgi:hypothetical protein